MHTKLYVICAWCGILSLLTLAVGVWPAAGFLPPLLPSASAEQIASIYRENADGIRLGTVLFALTGMLYLPFSIAIFLQMRRMESRELPLLSYCQLAGGFGGMMLFVVASVAWTVAAYRPDRAPDITQAFNDFGWLFFEMPSGLPFLQNASLGVAILLDKNTLSVMPRWLGFFNLWSAILYLPSGLNTFFKIGPFAWNGALAFWLPGLMFAIWVIVMTVYLHKGETD